MNSCDTLDRWWLPAVLVSQLGLSRLGVRVAFVVLNCVATIVCHGDDLQFDAARQRAHRNLSINRVVAGIGEKLDPNCDSDGLRLVQMLIEQEFDSFAVGRLVKERPVLGTNSNGSRTLVSLHDSVESALSNSHRDALARYEAHVSADANLRLSEALKEQSLSMLRRICRDFFLTASGYGAAEELVIRWLDAGEYGLAKRLAGRVMSEPAHSGRLTARFQEIARQLNSVEAAASETATVQDPRKAAENFQGEFARHRNSVELFGTGWMTIGGDPCRTRVIQGTFPVPVPLWRAEFVQDESRSEAQEYLDNWEAKQREVDQPRSPAVYPIVVAKRVLFRDSNGVRCVNASNGKTQWSFNCNQCVWSDIWNDNDAMVRSAFGVRENSSGRQQLATNSSAGVISSDGRLVFAVDSNPGIARGRNPDDQFGSSIGNRLVALQVDSASSHGTLAWVNDGVTNQNQSSDKVRSTREITGPSKRFSFLGPPLPGTTELLCVTEQTDEIHLTALAPRSGEMLWSQPLCTMDRPERIDVERRETACIPARADGIVVCPTNTGLLVAVDQSRTTLMWAVYVDEIVDRNVAQGRGGSRPVSLNYPGFVSCCRIANSRVVYLSPRGIKLYCIDIKTGRVLWDVPRGDAEFVGAVDEERVLIVGRNGCRCYGLKDGNELWSTTSVNSPIGFGLPIGEHYALPLESNRIALLHLKTGQDEGSRFLHSATLLGHLAADGDQVYSMSQRGLVAFPQVHQSLSQLNTPDVAITNGRREIVRAEAALVGNNPAEAERRLTSSLDGELSRDDHQRAARELKEVLFDRIIRDDNVTNADCDRLNQLVETPAEEFRFLTMLTQSSRTVRGKISPIELAQRIYRLPTDVTCSMPGDDRWLISPTAWCRLQASAGNDSVRELASFEWKRLNGQPEIPRSETEAAMRFVRVFAQQPGTESVRARLAAHMREEGLSHVAELLWLRNRSSPNPTIAAEAALSLIDFWERMGFINDALRQYDTLATSFSQTNLLNGVTCREALRRMDSSREVQQAWRQSRGPSWQVDRVDIVQSPISQQDLSTSVTGKTKNPSIRQLWNRQHPENHGRSLSIPGQPCEYSVQGGDQGHQQLVNVTDTRTMFPIGSFLVPFDVRWPYADKSLSGSHFLIVGTKGGAMGFSTAQLTESSPVWTYRPADLVGLRAVVNPGPWGIDFASFSWRNHLYVVDPIEGTLLWQRNLSIGGKEPQGNLRLEIIGDGQVLAIPSVDRTSFEVFETSTGRRLPDFRPGFSVLGDMGRHLYGLADSPKGRRLRIRDLLDEVPEVDEPIDDPVKKPIEVGGGEIAFVGGHELMVYDIVQHQKKMSVKMDESEMTVFNTARMFSDGSRYFLNLGRPTPTVQTRHFHQQINEQSIPGLIAKDHLYSFDRTTGRLLWKRSLFTRTILQFPDCQVPFLVTISQVKENVNTPPQSLAIEVIDSATGTTIGYREDLAYEPIQAAYYDGESGRIHLKGRSADIELRFGPAESSVNRQEER